jgi:hypothetical protein
MTTDFQGCLVVVKVSRGLARLPFETRSHHSNASTRQSSQIHPSFNDKMTALSAECRSMSATVSYANVSIAAIVIAEGQLKDIVQNLYNLIVQAYDHHGNKTQEAMKRETYVKYYWDRDRDCETHKSTASRSFRIL